MPLALSIQHFVIGALAGTAILCSAAGVHGHLRSFQFVVDDAPLGADVLANIKTIDGLDVNPARLHNIPFSGMELAAWTERNRGLHDYLAAREEVVLTFGAYTPHREPVVARLSPWSVEATLRYLGSPYLVAASHLLFAALACAGLGTFLALGVAFHAPPSIAPEIGLFVCSSTSLGLCGAIALSHFLLRYPFSAPYPVAIRYVIRGMYAYKERDLVRRELHDGLLNDLAVLYVTAEHLCLDREFGSPSTERRLEGLKSRVGTVVARVRTLLTTTRGGFSTWGEFLADVAIRSEAVLNAADVRFTGTVDPVLANLTTAGTRRW